MKKLTAPVLNLVLAVGVFLILAGLFCLSQVPAFASRLESGFPIFPVAACILGAGFLYATLVLKASSFFFFISLYVFLLGIIAFFFHIKVVPFMFVQIWPILMILCSVCLIVTCLRSARRLRTVYVFPAFLLAILGVFFMLFTFSIVQISFIDFTAKWWPLMLIFCGGGCVFIFLYQQTSDNKFPFEKDDSDIADGEEASV